jgi:hypothetical protein
MRKLQIVLCFFVGMLVCSCEKQVTEPDPSVPMKDFEAAWNRINNVYPFFAFKKINWDSLHTVYRPRVEAAQGMEFHSVLRDLLAELKDGHVYYKPLFSSAVTPWPTPRQIRDKDAFSLQVVESYFAGELRATSSASIKYEILPDTIGYIAVTDFNHEHFAQEWPDVLEYVRNTKGLIIDSRPNTGGSIQNVEALVTRFISTPMIWPELFLLGEMRPLTPLQPAGPFTYTKPVIVLINGCTFSAGELSTEILKQLPNITAVGDTTGGGGGAASNDSPGTVSKYTLPSGMMINTPTGYFLRYDGKHFEWLGVPPDIRIEQTEADVKQGRDKQLEYAIDMLR